MKNSPSGGCCRATTICNACVNGLGPDEYQIVISGFTNGTCFQANCANADGTFVLANVSACEWNNALTPFTLCGASHWYILTVDGSDVKVRLVQGAATQAQWALANDTFCLTWSSLSLTLNVPLSPILAATCAGTPTCSVTSL